MREPAGTIAGGVMSEMPTANAHSYARCVPWICRCRRKSRLDQFREARFTEEHRLREQEAGAKTADICRKHRFGGLQLGAVVLGWVRYLSCLRRRRSTMRC